MHQRRITAFGPEAQRIAGRLQGQVPMLLCDGAFAAEALAEAVRRRRAGEKYLVAALIDEPLNILARAAAFTIMAQFAHQDQRREMFEALAFGVLDFNGGPIAKQPAYLPEVLNTLREISQFGDGLFVRSITERTRIETTFSRKRMFVAAAPLIDQTVPGIRPNRDARHVVVWAPHETAENLCMYSYALWHLKLPAIFVCNGVLAGSPHRFVSPDRASEALAEAAVIVDTQTTDPGTALAFAGRGYGIACPATSGAHEHVQAIATFNTHDFATIHGAVTRARAERRTFALPSVDAITTIRATIASSQPLIPDHPPLVSVVVPTYNRPLELRANLEAFSKQTYPNFEVVVVNDCGEDVSGIVAEFPFARYIRTPENLGCCGACNVGLRAARGEYSALLADDDRDYPMFISTLVAAIEASHVDVAHGDIVLRLDTKLPGDVKATYGHTLLHDGDHDAFAALFGMMIHGQSYIVRHSAYEKIGFVDESLFCASDVDCYIRLSNAYDFAHATCVVGEMSYRDDKTNLSSRIGNDLAVSIEDVLIKFAPPDSPLTAARISQVVQNAAYGAQQGVFFAPWIRLGQPIEVFRSEDPAIAAKV